MSLKIKDLRRGILKRRAERMEFYFVNDSGSDESETYALKEKVTPFSIK